jgi:hypothetical protein
MPPMLIRRTAFFIKNGLMEAVNIVQNHQDRFNRVITDWGRQSRRQFLLNIRQLPFRERVMWENRNPDDILRGRVGVRFNKFYGDIVRVGWPFTKHGIMQEHGVGRGRKKNSDKAKPMPWIVKTLDAEIPQLADALQDENIKSLGMVVKIKINGLYEIELT